MGITNYPGKNITKFNFKLSQFEHFVAAEKFNNVKKSDSSTVFKYSLFG